MFDFIGEFIGEFLFAILCKYPGGFIRWVIFRKKPLEGYLNSDWYLNILPVAVLITIIIVIVNIFK